MLFATVFTGHVIGKDQCQAEPVSEKKYVKKLNVLRSLGWAAENADVIRTCPTHSSRVVPPALLFEAAPALHPATTFPRLIQLSTRSVMTDDLSSHALACAQLPLHLDGISLRNVSAHSTIDLFADTCNPPSLAVPRIQFLARHSQDYILFKFYSILACTSPRIGCL